MLLAPAASHYCGSSVCGAPGRLLVIVRVALLAVGFIGLRWLLRIFVCDLGPITPISESPIWGGSSTPQLLCLFLRPDLAGEWSGFRVLTFYYVDEVLVRHT